MAKREGGVYEIREWNLIEKVPLDFTIVYGHKIGNKCIRKSTFIKSQISFSFAQNEQNSLSRNVR